MMTNNERTINKKKHERFITKSCNCFFRQTKVEHSQLWLYNQINFVCFELNQMALDMYTAITCSSNEQQVLKVTFALKQCNAKKSLFELFNYIFIYEIWTRDINKRRKKKEWRKEEKSHKCGNAHSIHTQRLPVPVTLMVPRKNWWITFMAHAVQIVLNKM